MYIIYWSNGGLLQNVLNMSLSGSDIFISVLLGADLYWDLEKGVLMSFVICYYFNISLPLWNILDVFN